MQRLHATALAMLLAGAASGCACNGDTLPCRVEPRADGHRYLVCPDGTETVLPDERPVVPRGSIAGAARLFGRDQAGVRVSTSATVDGGGTREFETRTDAAGRYRLDGLPPGHRAFLFGFPGYVSDTRPALVLPGTLELPEPVTLWQGRLLRTGAVTLEPLPGGRRFLAFEAGGELSLWDGKEGAGAVVHPRCTGYVVAGDAVYFSGVEDPAKSPPLDRLDLANGERTRLFPEVLAWVVAPEGRAVAALVPTATGRFLQVRETATGRIATPTREPWSFTFGPEGRRLLVGADGASVLWDVAAAAGTVVGPFTGGAAFGPTDDLVATATSVFDAGRERSWSFDFGALATFTDDGRFAIRAADGALDVLDLERGVRATVPVAGEWAVGDDALFFVGAAPEGPALFRRELVGGATVPLATGDRFSRLVPVPGGRVLYLRARTGTAGPAAVPADPARGVAELWDPARGVVALEALPGPGAWAGAVSPDGAAILHGDGNRLRRYDLAAGSDDPIAEHVSDFPSGTTHAWWGPGGRFALVTDGALAVWDPALGLRTVGPGPGPASTLAFLPDGSVAAVRHHTGRAGELVRLDLAADRVEVLAEGVTALAVEPDGLYGFASIGRPELPPAVFHRLDRATGTAVPLEADVAQRLVGDGFLAYTTAPGTADNPRPAGLYLIRDETETPTESP